MSQVSNRSVRVFVRTVGVALIALLLLTFSAGRASALPGPCSDHGDGNDPARHYICILYNAFLHSPSDGEVSYWIDVLSTSSSVVVAADLIGSQEVAQKFASQAYDQFLSRASDPAGTRYWVDRLQAGDSFETIEIALASSDEAYAVAGGTPDDFVAYLYDTFLDRAAGPDEISFWSAAISDGTLTRGQVASAFGHSTEYEQTFVENIYDGFLGRSPDPEGFAYWTGVAMSAGRRVVYIQIAGSAEGFAFLSTVV